MSEAAFSQAIESVAANLGPWFRLEPAATEGAVGERELYATVFVGNSIDYSLTIGLRERPSEYPWFAFGPALGHRVEIEADSAESCIQQGLSLIKAGVSRSPEN